MAEHRRYQNISVQPLSVSRSAKPAFELPRETLNEAEILRKSTSDLSKRRVAHHAWFPLPVIRQPTVPAKEKKKNQKKPKEDKKNVLLKKIVKSCKKRQIKDTVAVKDSIVVHKLSNSVDGSKRKTKVLDSQDVWKIKQKKIKVDRSKNKGPSQEVGNRKRKTELHDNKDIQEKKQKKSRLTNLKKKNSSIKRNMESEKKFVCPNISLHIWSQP